VAEKSFAGFPPAPLRSPYANLPSRTAPRRKPARRSASSIDHVVLALAASRIIAECARLERLGVINAINANDANGNLVSTELPLDMHPESNTPVETG
jgi:hypothetical protein